jgi:hypothetical protein
MGKENEKEHARFEEIVGQIDKLTRILNSDEGRNWFSTDLELLIPDGIRGAFQAGYIDGYCFRLDNIDDGLPDLDALGVNLGLSKLKCWYLEL